MTSNERVYIALPTGVLQKGVLDCMKGIGLAFNDEPRCYQVVVANMPINFHLLRASSIPEIVANPESRTIAGITSSNILWESGLGKTASEEFPLYVLQPTAPQSQLYIGATEQFIRWVEETKDKPVEVTDLQGSRVATKYLNIAREIFAEKGVLNIRFYQIPGSDEGLQYAFGDCHGVLSILSTGETLRANHLQILEIVHHVVLRMIENHDKMSRSDKAVLDDLREKIAAALEKKRVL